MDPTPLGSRRRPPWAWRAPLTALVWVLRSILGWRVQVRRPAQLPDRSRPLVIVYNHTSNVDTFLVADAVWRRLGYWGRPLAKAELFDMPVIGAIARAAGVIPVDRAAGAAREAAYGHAIAQLSTGDTILVAPEGTLTHDGRLLPLRHGAARLALEAGADVLVVTHLGAQRGFSPVVRVPELGVVVSMTLDLLTPLPEEDATSLTGRIAATLLDRSAELRATYPQADPTARWWPPYATPARPSATARDSLHRYQQSMTEAVAAARERMPRIASEHVLEDRAHRARDRVEELAEQARDRIEEMAEHAQDRVEDLAEHARDRLDDLTTQVRRAASHTPPRGQAPGHDQGQPPARPPRTDGASQVGRHPD